MNSKTNISVTQNVIDKINESVIKLQDTAEVASYDDNISLLRLEKGSAKSDFSIEVGDPEMQEVFLDHLIDKISINSLLDVNISNVTNVENIENYLLKFSSGEWIHSNDISLGNITSSNTLMLGTGAGLSLTPAATHPEFVLGNILSFESNANGGLELSDCDDTSGYLNIPFGVALETSAANSTTAIKVHTVHGGKVNVKISSSTTNQGQWIYLSNTAGIGTTTVPASGLVWRLGLSTERNTSAVTDVDIIWMPQFIADLG